MFSTTFIHFSFGGNYYAYHSGHRQKTITVPWNYQQKLNDMNKLIAEYSGGTMAAKTFTGYIDEIWKECIKNSDQCVVTGKKPTPKK